MKNGHRFVSRRTKDNPALEERHRPANAGDFGCLLCGSWTTYCTSAEQADEKMGRCPDRVDGGPTGPDTPMLALGHWWDWDPIGRVWLRGRKADE